MLFHDVDINDVFLSTTDREFSWVLVAMHFWFHKVCYVGFRCFSHNSYSSNFLLLRCDCTDKSPFRRLRANYLRLGSFFCSIGGRAKRRLASAFCLFFYVCWGIHIDS